MKHKLSGLYYIIPVVYVAVIGLFLYMQFQSGKRFEEKVGGVTVAGTYVRRLTGGQRLGRLEVRMNDLRLPIDSRSPILAGFGEVRDKKIVARSYTSYADGLEIECDGGLLLRFELSGPPVQAVRLTPVIPKALGTLSTLSLPFRLDQEEQIKSIPGIPLYELSGSLGEWYVALPAGSTLDPERRRLVVRIPRDDGSPAVTFERLERPQEPYLYWFSREAPLVGTERYVEEVGGFLDRAYRSWSRLAAEQPANPALAGKIGISLLSESLPRGEYRTMLALVSRSIRQIIREAPQTEIQYAGACFLGDLPTFLGRRQAQAIEETSLLTELIRRADLTLFATPNLIAFIVDHAPFSLAEEVLRLADSTDLEREGLFDVLNITASYLEALEILSLGEKTLQRVAAAVETRILPALRAAGGGLYFVLEDRAGPTPVDLYTSVQAGKVLSGAGRLLQKPAYEELGRTLILTVLRQAGPGGSVPARGRLEAGRFAADTERIPPEELYALVAEGGYTPREHPLYSYLYPGSWILTASHLEGVEIDQRQQRFLFSFPQGQTHYLLIQGVRPPVGVIVHGVPWKQDPQYFSYSDGWAYGETTQSLFVKLTHRDEAEEIIINY